MHQNGMSHIKKEPVLEMCSSNNAALFQWNWRTGKPISKFATPLVIGLFPYIRFNNKHSPCYNILHICKYLQLWTTYETGSFWSITGIFIIYIGISAFSRRYIIEHQQSNILGNESDSMDNRAIYVRSTLHVTLCTTLPSFY